MNRYEKLMTDYNNIEIDDTHNLPDSFSGLYVDGIILIDKNLNSESKLEVLAEEIAHYKITAGNILNLSNPLNAMFENKARRLSHELIITLDDLIAAHKQGVQSLYEMTQYFEVSSDCIQSCLNHYKQKFGLSVKHKGYLITFEPLHVESLKK